MLLVCVERKISAQKGEAAISNMCFFLPYDIAWKHFFSLFLNGCKVLRQSYILAHFSVSHLSIWVARWESAWMVICISLSDARKNSSPPFLKIHFRPKTTNLLKTSCIDGFYLSSKSHNMHQWLLIPQIDRSCLLACFILSSITVFFIQFAWQVEVYIQCCDMHIEHKYEDLFLLHHIFNWSQDRLYLLFICD